MSAFTAAERRYLKGQSLGRLATVGRDGSPHVTPTTFVYVAETDSIDIAGHNLARSKKYRDARDNPQVAFVVDDIASVDPWTVRGVEIRGRAELSSTHEGQGYDNNTLIRIRPERIIGWGLDTHPYRPHARDVT